MRLRFPSTVELFGGWQTHQSTSGGLYSRLDGHVFGPVGIVSTHDGTFSRFTKMNSRPHRLFSRRKAVYSCLDGLHSAGDGLLSTREATHSTSDKVFSTGGNLSPARTKVCADGAKATAIQTNAAPARIIRQPNGKKPARLGETFVQAGNSSIGAGQSSLGAGRMPVRAANDASQGVSTLMSPGSQGKRPDFQTAASRKPASLAHANRSRDPDTSGCHFSPINQQTPKTNSNHVESTGYLGWDGHSGQSIDLGYARPFLGWPRS